ncbi:hypothetical protein [Rivularia sp. UHCC 0363]|uniref:hypothetical protein n=1 Tax=Rivularia sp. UHCC 0363 TaxID=3110244 RepID=UPI002B1F87C1|nr:hypothetical protein [Rivularia sp. UHCC 0363]MEA5593661.1 hypothetical protein [Rivularia sp. UHCC 0363]
MIKPKIKRKMPKCIQCRFYQGNIIVCKMYPNGPEDNSCPYYAPDPDVYLDRDGSNN